jgi:hypothetical protein
MAENIELTKMKFDCLSFKATAATADAVLSKNNWLI